jgi:hypothetical protein
MTDKPKNTAEMKRHLPDKKYCHTYRKNRWEDVSERRSGPEGYHAPALVKREK